MSTAIAQEPNLVLNPFSTYDASSMQKSNDRWSRVWLIAALVTAVAFTALAVATILYTTVNLPTHLPTVSILVFAVGMPTSFKAFKRLWDKKDHYSQEALIDRHLIHNLENQKKSFLKNSNNSQSKIQYTIPLKDQISKLGISCDLSNEKAIHPLLARFTYFQGKKEKHKENEAALLEGKMRPLEKVKFHLKKSLKKLDEKQMQQVRSLEERQQAAMSQITSAYFLHLMQNPYETKKLSEFFTNFSANSSQRLVAKATGDSSWDLLIKTDKKSYSIDDVLGAKPAKLAKEIFQGKMGFFY